MRRTSIVLLAAFATLLLTSAPASAAPVLTGVTLPRATDATQVRVDWTWSSGGDPDCSHPNPQFRIAAGAWQEIHPTRSLVHLPDVLGSHRVEFRVLDSCGGASPVVVREIVLVADGVLDPRLTSVTVPATTAGDTIQVQAAAAAGPYGMPAVGWIRFATEDGNWGAWRAFAATSAAPVSAGIGYKAVFVQVSDGQRSSNVALRRFTRVAATTLAPLAAAHEGWVSVAGATARPTWRWTAAGWAAPTTIAPGARVYASPFTAGWHWTWHTGAWHAMRSADLRA